MASKDFKNGKIYCIRNTVDDDIYVGSTTQPLSKRMSKHRCDVKGYKQNRKLYAKMNELGIDSFYIELIEEYPCDNVEQLRKREGHFIREISTLNQHVAGRSGADWYAEHKDILKEKHKYYREKNIEHCIEVMKKYQSENNDKIKEWKTTRHNCGCGSCYTNANKSEHMKTKKHQNWLQQQNTND